MTLRLAVACVLLVAVPAAAHPSVSVVIAPTGEVFYSDLERVWVIGTDGHKRVAVPNVHAHELMIDGSGALLGEDVRWLGGDRYQHRLWKREPNGRLSDVVPWTEGFWREYGFTRDSAGNDYWVACTPSNVCTVRTRSPRSIARSLTSPGAFSMPINWIKATPAGEVYVAEGAFLRRIDRRGKVSTAARISSRADGRHTLMGMALDAAGNVYVAAYMDRTITRVSPSGKVGVVARSEAPWGPSGVAVTSRGELWILEWSGANARLRRLQANGRSTVY